MNKRPVILIGGGGHCKSVVDVAESIGVEVLGILDTPDKIGNDVLGYKVIGSDDDIYTYASKADFVITIGHIKSSNLRVKIFDLICKSGGTLATLIASTAHVSRHAVIEEGTVIMHSAVVNAGAVIGKNCIINTFANIEHDSNIGNFCHISTGAMVNGDCIVGDNTFIGSGSVLANGISVPSNSIVAASTFMRETYKKEGLYAGNPAILYR